MCQLKSLLDFITLSHLENDERRRPGCRLWFKKSKLATGKGKNGKNVSGSALHQVRGKPQQNDCHSRAGGSPAKKAVDSCLRRTFPCEGRGTTSRETGTMLREYGAMPSRKYANDIKRNGGTVE